MATTKRPDATCATGVVSLAGSIAGRPQACCPAYCGECSDYETCSKIRGQDSANSCCATKVLDRECGGEGGTPANECLKQCKESAPPCIMAEGVTWEAPEETSAAEDCDNAEDEWMTKAENAVKAAPGGDDQWSDLSGSLSA